MEEFKLAPWQQYIWEHPEIIQRHRWSFDDHLNFDDSVDAIRYGFEWAIKSPKFSDEPESYTRVEAELLMAQAATAYMALTGWSPTLLLVNRKIMQPIREYAGAKEGDTILSWTGFRVQETDEAGVTAIGPYR